MLTSSPGYHRPRRVVRVGANYDDEHIATTAAEVGSVQCDVVGLRIGASASFSTCMMPSGAFSLTYIIVVTVSRTHPPGSDVLRYVAALVGEEAGCWTKLDLKCMITDDGSLSCDPHGRL